MLHLTAYSKWPNKNIKIYICLWLALLDRFLSFSLFLFLPSHVGFPPSWYVKDELKQKNVFPVWTDGGLGCSIFLWQCLNCVLASCHAVRLYPLLTDQHKECFMRACIYPWMLPALRAKSQIHLSAFPLVIFSGCRTSGRSCLTWNFVHT